MDGFIKRNLKRRREMMLKNLNRSSRNRTTTKERSKGSALEPVSP
jgi:hypothetical protein